MELIVGKKYNLRKTGDVCHISGENLNIKQVEEYNPYIFVGKIDTDSFKDRHIFMSSKRSKIYVMYGSNNIERYASPYTIKVSLKELAKEYGVIVEQIEIIA